MIFWNIIILEIACTEAPADTMFCTIRWCWVQMSDQPCWDSLARTQVLSLQERLAQSSARFSAAAVTQSLPASLTQPILKLSHQRSVRAKTAATCVACAGMDQQE